MFDQQVGENGGSARRARRAIRGHGPRRTPGARGAAVGFGRARRDPSCGQGQSALCGAVGLLVAVDDVPNCSTASPSGSRGAPSVPKRVSTRLGPGGQLDRHVDDCPWPPTSPISPQRRGRAGTL
jgi:hypothetical protein